MGKRHPVFARFYTLGSRAMERGEMGAHRDRLLAGASGRVIEIGCGNGMNFRHYGDAVKEVLAVEPEPYLRARAAEEAARAPVPVTVVEGDAMRLPAGDAEFDVAVFSLVLCSVPDQARALAEAARVLVPGGELRFFEHIAAKQGSRRRSVQQALDRTAWPWFAAGCHTARETPDAIRRAGFSISSIDEFDFPGGVFGYPVAPHALGIARRG